MKRLFSRAHRRLVESVRIARFGIGIFGVLSVFFSLLFRSNDRCYPLTLAFKRNGIRFSFTFQSHAELMLFHEIFCFNPYQVRLPQSPAFIFDLGANIGISTLYLYTEYPEAKIGAVEPNPALAPRLRRMFSGMPWITVIEAAASDGDGTATLYLNQEASVGSSLAPRPENTSSTTVPVRTLASLKQDIGFPRIDFIKFDIEGAEWKAFSTYPKRDALYGFAGEYHEDLTGKSPKEFAGLWPHMRIWWEPTKKQGRFIIYGTPS